MSGADITAAEVAPSPIRPWRRVILICAAVLLTLLALAAGIWWRRRCGFAEFDRVIAEARARGEPTTVSDLITIDARIEDPARSSRDRQWWDWCRTSLSNDFVADRSAIERWMLDRSAPPPSLDRALSAWVDRGTELLREGVDSSLLGEVALAQSDDGYGAGECTNPIPARHANDGRSLVRPSARQRRRPGPA